MELQRYKRSRENKNEAMNSRVNKKDYDETTGRMWEAATKEIDSIESSMESWKNQVLPLARIKKIMKSGELIHNTNEKNQMNKNKHNGNDSDTSHPRFMIKNEATVFMGKACELLIRELATSSWEHTERSRRRTLQKIDVQAAVEENEVYDFLIDIVPRVPQNVSRMETAAEVSSNRQAIPISTIPSPSFNNNAQLSRMNIPEAALNFPRAMQHEAGMRLVNAERRLQQLQEMQQKLILQQQRLPSLNSVQYPTLTIPIQQVMQQNLLTSQWSPMYQTIQGDQNKMHLEHLMMQRQMQENSSPI